MLMWLWAPSGRDPELHWVRVSRHLLRVNGVWLGRSAAFSQTFRCLATMVSGDIFHNLSVLELFVLEAIVHLFRFRTVASQCFSPFTALYRRIAYTVMMLQSLDGVSILH